MDNTFTRALIGFVVLTFAIAGMSLIALQSLQSFAGAPWWAMLLVTVIALVAEIGVYTTTLHEPIYDWIKEPKRRREHDDSVAKAHTNGYEMGKRDAERNADRNSGQNPAK